MASVYHELETASVDIVAGEEGDIHFEQNIYLNI